MLSNGEVRISKTVAIICWRTGTKFGLALDKQGTSQTSLEKIWLVVSEEMRERKLFTDGHKDGLTRAVPVWYKWQSVWDKLYLSTAKNLLRILSRFVWLMSDSETLAKFCKLCYTIPNIFSRFNDSTVICFTWHLWLLLHLFSLDLPVFCLPEESGETFGFFWYAWNNSLCKKKHYVCLASWVKFSTEYIVKYLSFFFLENRIWHFKQLVSTGINLHEMSNPVFWKKYMYHQYGIRLYPNLFLFKRWGKWREEVDLILNQFLWNYVA